MNLIFENYNMFLNENNEMFSSTKNVQRLLTDDGQFRAFVESLVDGVDASVRPAIVNVLNRQRYSILSEAATGANFATGWTVSSFPILTDIYAEPIISELANIYPTDKPMISIPRIKIKATTTGYDGTTVSTKYMPTATSLIRVGEETVQVQPGMSVNVFNALGDIDSNKFKMNRRYTLATVIDVTETKANGTTTVNHSIPVSIRPDNRNQLIGEFSFVDTPASGTGVTVNCTLNGNVNFDSGIIILNVVFGAGTASHTFECNFVSFKLRFTPVGTLAGRTKVSVEQTNTDVTIDPNEDFMLDMSAEEMQDYESIFKIDLIQTVSEAIKRQMTLNKDYDLAFFLSAAETQIAALGAANTLNLADYAVAANGFTPSNVLDLFKSIIPQLSSLMGIVRKNFLMYPSYMVTGMKTAAILRSLQELAVSLPDVRGDLGFNGSMAQFSKMKILESTVVADNKIYMSTKAPSTNLEKTTIVDLIYKPFYVVEETTDGQTRRFIRSRTMIDVLRAEGLGCLTITGADSYLS